MASILVKTERGQITAVSIPRQNFKTELACIFLFIGALLGESGVFFGHNGDIVREALRRMVAICRPLVKTGIVRKITDSHGFQTIEFATGAILYFRIRTSGATVGLTVDRIVFDEAQKLSGDFFEEASPTLTHSKSKKILFIGTPATDEDYKRYPDSPFHKMKRESSPDLIEYSGADKYDPSIELNLAVAKKANPAWKLIPDFAKLVKQEQATMSHEAFCRQRLGIWKIETAEVHEPYFKPSATKDFFTARGSRSNIFEAGLGITPTADKAFISMNDGQVIEVAAEFDLSSGDLDPVIQWIYERGRTVRVVNIPANAKGKVIEQSLKANRFMKTRLSTLPETSTSLVRLLKSLEQGDLKLFENSEVATAINSFWLGFDDRSGSSVIQSGDENDISLMLSLCLSTRIGLNRTAPRPQREGAAEPEQKQVNWSF